MQVLLLINSELSDSIQMSYGLPRGSVIGPPCFVFYTHVVGQILHCHKIINHLYADCI